MRKKSYHKIITAYDAWWFLYYHPFLICRERVEITRKEAEEGIKKGYYITHDRKGTKQDPGGKYWREWRHKLRHAIVTNLSIFYAKVNDKGQVDDDDSKNLYPECWLEIGSIDYDYMCPWDNTTTRMEYHDVDLDVGGKTFDEALIKMAKRVRKLHGDYDPSLGTKGECGKPICGDCVDFKAYVTDFNNQHFKDQEW